MYTTVTKEKRRRNISTAYMSVDDTLHLKTLIVKAGYTITTLAEAVGMKRTTLSARINGRVDFGRKEMMMIAEKLNKTPQEIFLN